MADAISVLPLMRNRLLFGSEPILLVLLGSEPVLFVLVEFTTTAFLRLTVELDHGQPRMSCAKRKILQRG
jgi:hypothetical protein